MNIIRHSYSSIGFVREERKTIVHQFIDWCKTQEKNRLLWVAVIITGHGCLITPLTALFVLSAGNSIFSWALIMTAMAMSLVVNLAALPTKYTIPVFFVSLLIDLVVIINCVVIGLSFPGA